MRNLKYILHSLLKLILWGIKRRISTFISFIIIYIIFDEYYTYWMSSFLLTHALCFSFSFPFRFPFHFTGLRVFPFFFMAHCQFTIWLWHCPHLSKSNGCRKCLASFLFGPHPLLYKSYFVYLNSTEIQVRLLIAHKSIKLCFIWIFH